MRIDTLSAKQGQIFDFVESEENALICDGAVRSGKTVAMLAAFTIWAMEHFCNTNFAICGKTVQSAERNLLKPLMQLEGLPYTFSYKRSEKTLLVKNGLQVNTFYFFGGKDESSYTLIQGLTLAGVLFDEIALMPRSFVEQAIARTLSYEQAKLWFNCNPDAPTHWFYQEWIQQPKDDVRHIHFLMRDNPIMTPDKIQKAESMYRGVFYDRYIRGLWVRAEGIVFPEFAEHTGRYCIGKAQLPGSFRWACVGFDIGGNGSAYALTCAAEGADGVIYILRSCKKQAQELPMEQVEAFVFDFLDGVERDYKIAVGTVNCDHSDVVINTLNERRYIFDKTYKPPLEDRPFLFSVLMARGRFKIVKDACADLVFELQNLVYDPDEERTIVLDDGSMQIDAWDSMTYAVSREWKYLSDI